MDLPNITVCGVTDFQSINSEDFTHVISIWHPNEDLKEYQRQINSGFPYADVHFATFNDSEDYLEDNSPSITDVEKILNFTKILTKDANLLIHCMAGISRSTAAAIAVITQALGPGSETQAAQTIKKNRRVADPNRLVIHFADQILKRNNALVEATDSIFGISTATCNKGWN